MDERIAKIKELRAEEKKRFANYTFLREQMNLELEKYMSVSAELDSLLEVENV